MTSNSQCSIKRDKRINLVLALCFKEIQISIKIRVLPSGSFSYTPDFRHCISIVERAINLAGRSQQDQLDRLWSTKLTTTLSSDARPTA